MFGRFNRGLSRVRTGGRTRPDMAQVAPREPARDSTRDVEWLFADILVDIPRFHSLKGRLALLQEVDPQRRITVEEDLNARDHLRAIVGAVRRTVTLDSLQVALARLEPEDICIGWFDLAKAVLTGPRGPVDTDSMLKLIGELHAQPTEFGLTAVRRFVAECRAAGRRLDAGNVPEVLLLLCDPWSAPVDGSGISAPHLPRFFELLAEEALMKPDLARLLTTLQDQSRAQAQDQAPAPAPASADCTDRQVIIQIRVEEAGPPSDLPPARRQYSLRGYYYERRGDERPVFLGSQALPDPVTGEELGRCARDFLAVWQELTEAAWGVTKRVEFLLPHSLLGQPVESWADAPGVVPLGRIGQVVVRSLVRYRDRLIHDPWIRRWEALDRGCTPGDALWRIGWMGPGDAPGGANSPPKEWSCPDSRYPSLRLSHAADVADWLREYVDLSCLGLGTPYDHDDELIREAVSGALLEDGIPVMVWRRDDSDPGSLLDVLRGCKEPERLRNLPESVHEARKDGRRDEKSVHNHITLLWDDPTCVFSNQDQQMSGTRGVGEGAA